ncbi:MAG: GIY-YIG nuclease family protein [Chlorobiales bacterium]|nr:GIY-YIG nuclease family protein [Chlorobiales bacterium]
MKEIVYVLINEAMPGYVKLGRTTNLEQRIRNLDNTSAPLPFECFYACTVNDANFVESQLHDAFADVRVRSNREFFEIAPERIASALRIAQIEDVTPKQDFVETEEDQVALNEAKKRRAVFNFRLANVPAGALLAFARDKEKTCAVVDNKYVEYDGDVMSLSESARRVLEEMGYNWKAVQGPLYWEYEGETLDERRKRLEEED